MDQIYFERPEYLPAPVLCVKGCKRPPAPNRKCCEQCLATARKGFWAHRDARNARSRQRRQEARVAGKCTNCFTRDATPNRAWCEPCRESNAHVYANLSPQQRARRASQAMQYWHRTKKKRKKRERRTPEGRAMAQRHKLRGKINAVARAEAERTGRSIWMVLKAMGAEPSHVDWWRQREERGYVR